MARAIILPRSVRDSLAAYISICLKDVTSVDRVTHDVTEDGYFEFGLKEGVRVFEPKTWREWPEEHKAIIKEILNMNLDYKEEIDRLCELGANAVSKVVPKKERLGIFEVSRIVVEALAAENALRYKTEAPAIVSAHEDAHEAWHKQNQQFHKALLRIWRALGDGREQKTFGSDPDVVADEAVKALVK